MSPPTRAADTLNLHPILPLTLAALSLGGVVLLWWPVRRTAPRPA